MAYERVKPTYEDLYVSHPVLYTHFNIILPHTTAAVPSSRAV